MGTRKVMGRLSKWQTTVLVLSLVFVAYLLTRSASPSVIGGGVIERVFYNDSVHSETSATPPRKCTFHACVDVYRCGVDDAPRLSVYVYPETVYVDQDDYEVAPPAAAWSREFAEIRAAVAGSHYATSDPRTACLLLALLDLLNERAVNIRRTEAMLRSLKYWNSGTNHLIFNAISNPYQKDTALSVDVGLALIAAADVPFHHFRRTMDVAIPLFTSHNITRLHSTSTRKLRLITTNVIMLAEKTKTTLRTISRQLGGVTGGGLLLLDRCADLQPGVGGTKQLCSPESIVYNFTDAQRTSKFCLIMRQHRFVQRELFDAIHFGCIPIIASDSYVLPFHEKIDWTRCSIRIREAQIEDVVTLIKQFDTENKLKEMRRQGAWLLDTYMSTPTAIAMTTLRVLNERLFPYKADSYAEWNDSPDLRITPPPLFMPLTGPPTDGFTAVILTYDRLTSLYTLLRRLVQCDSLTAIVVVWNNQLKFPPSADHWPKLNKPVKVIQTRHNRLSNRFFPYDAIETEAILQLDDDILMLTNDEIEFAYQVWREYPDRLVGFPSRLHVIPSNGSSSYTYSSEWTSALSMVLTGAAFHHKYYSEMYTYKMPSQLKHWVDLHFNCEDIAMNFLIANVTGKSPIKITPRQKFKCPECSAATAMLSSDVAHMVERNECIRKFTMDYYNNKLPLKTVEFRMDPVLYKMDPSLPKILRKYSNIGNL